MTNLDDIIRPANEAKDTTVVDVPPEDEYTPPVQHIPSAAFPPKITIRERIATNGYVVAVKDVVVGYWYAFAGGLAVIGVIWLIWFAFIQTKPHNLTIERFSWERKIEVIRFRPENRQGWNRPPGDAYNVDRDYRYHYSERYVSGHHTESYSCGSYDKPRTCTRQVTDYSTRAVYDWYYTYTVDRWGHSRWITTAASDHSMPYWADLSNEHFDSSDVIGNEQLSGVRNENYVVYTIDTDDNNRAHSHGIDLATWSKLSVGQTVVGHVNRNHNVRSVDWLPK